MSPPSVPEPAPGRGWRGCLPGRWGMPRAHACAHAHMLTYACIRCTTTCGHMLICTRTLASLHTHKCARTYDPLLLTHTHMDTLVLAHLRAKRSSSCPPGWPHGAVRPWALRASPTRASRTPPTAPLPGLSGRDPRHGPLTLVDTKGCGDRLSDSQRTPVPSPLPGLEVPPYPAGRPSLQREWLVRRPCRGA